MVSHPKTKTEYYQLVQTGKVIVDFGAKWCGPCQTIAPYFEQLSKTFKNIKFVKVDVDELQSLSSEVGVSAMPTFFFYVDGKVVDQLVGASKDQLYALLYKYYSSNNSSSSSSSYPSTPSCSTYRCP